MIEPNLDRWLTATPADRAHREGCNCPDCHAWHIEDSQIYDNAKRPEYLCCQDALEAYEAHAASMTE